MWAKIIRDLMDEQALSQRSLARQAGVSRQTLRGLVVHRRSIRIDQLEAILNALGHDLEAIPTGDAPCHMPLRQSDPAAVSSPEARVAVTRSNTIGSAKPGSTKPAPQPENAATAPSGSKPAKRTLLLIRRAPAAATPRPSSITSSPTKATSGSSGPGQTGKPSASAAIQGRSKRKTEEHRITFAGKTLSIPEWSAITGIPYFVLYQRLVACEWPPERAFATPVRTRERARNRRLISRIASTFHEARA